MTSGYWKRRLLEWLKTNEFDSILPEVAALRGVPQPPEYHPEGDAFVHTLLAVGEVSDNDDQRVFWAVMLHDIGKKFTTEFRNGRWRSHGHDAAGARLIPAICRRIGIDDIANDITWLVRYHHFHHAWNLHPGQKLTARQQKFTEHPLFKLLEKVCAADQAGRKPPYHQDL